MIYHVLLVEDEPVIRESIKKSIHWDRMPIQLAAEAENGREALAYMQTMPIDIVITDMRMPACDGSQMLKQMESLHYNCEIIVLSEYSDFSYMWGIRSAIASTAASRSRLCAMRSHMSPIT